MDWEFARGRVVGRKRVAVITGANSGLGFETARVLLGAGMRVVCACRSEERGQEAVASLAVVTATRPDPSPDDIVALPLDVSSLASVRTFAERWLKGDEPIHALLCNAGIMMGPPRRSVDDIDLQVATNHVGHFLLCSLLRPRLEASAPARVVHVSSLAARFGHIHFDGLDAPADNYNSRAVYSASKLMQIVFSRELNARLAGTGVTSNSLEPGVVATSLSKGITDDPQMRARLENGVSVDVGARTQSFLCGAGAVDGHGGGHWVDCEDVSTGSARGRSVFAAHSLRGDAGPLLWQGTERLISSRSGAR